MKIPPALSALFLPVLAAITPAFATDALALQLQAKENRVKLLFHEIKATDDRIEDRIDLIVQKLSGMVDSKESKSQIAQLKKETMTSLQDTAENCRRRRAALLEEIRLPKMNLTLEQKKEIISVFDDRVEKRIQQILTLQKSFPDAGEAGKYRTGGGSYNRPYFAEKAQQQQNKRLAQQSDLLRGKVTSALKESIDRLDNQNRALRTRAASVTDSTQQDLINSEIARNDAIIAERRKQLTETFNGSSTSARAVTRGEVSDLNKVLREANTDLRRDINTLFQRYSEYLPALADMNAQRASYEAQKK